MIAPAFYTFYFIFDIELSCESIEHVLLQDSLNEQAAHFPCVLFLICRANIQPA